MSIRENIFKKERPLTQCFHGNTMYNRSTKVSMLILFYYLVFGGAGGVKCLCSEMQSTENENFDIH